MKQTEYKTLFVDRMTPCPKDGTLYMLPQFNVAIHNCMCGCGKQVVTPLGDGQWSWSFDGDSTTLSPSVGNFQYDCKSHYFLRQGKVTWV